MLLELIGRVWCDQYICHNSFSVNETFSFVHMKDKEEWISQNVFRITKVTKKNAVYDLTNFYNENDSSQNYRLYKK